MFNKRNVAAAVFLTGAVACSSQSAGWSVGFSAGQGTFSIVSPVLAARGIHAGVYLSGATAPVRLASLAPVTQDAIPFADAFGSGTMTVLSGGDGSGLSFSVSIRDYGKAFFRAVETVRNEGPAPLAIEGFSLGMTGDPGSRLDGAGANSAVLSNGYQSWSPSIVVRMAGENAAEEEFENTANDGDTTSFNGGAGWWYGATVVPGAGLVSGALTADRWKTKVLTYTRQGIALWGIISGHSWGNSPATRDRVILHPGESVSSEDLFIGLYQDPLDGLEEYARIAATLTPPPPAPFIPVGWNSWNTYFANITEGTIRENAQFLHDRFPGFGYNNIQIDDGWESGWGEWTTSTTRFPSGMAQMAQTITGLGFTAGIWMAPFLVSAGNPLTLTNPSWVLRDEAGAPLFAFSNYIIDTTNPQALAWVLGNIQSLLDWGYRYLKLDFLFAGSYEAKRFRAGATGMEAYREALGAIHARAAQYGAYVLACGAPILPTAGYAHGIRIGGDIALGNLPYEIHFIKNEARNSISRYFLNTWFAGDPDTALIRDAPLEDARINITAALLAGKIFGLGDALPALSDERLALLTPLRDFPLFAEIADPSGPPLLARPVGLFDNPQPPPGSMPEMTALARYSLPSVVALPLSRGGAVVGVFNWTESDARISASLASMKLPPGPYAARELWTGQDLGTVSTTLEIAQGKRSASLIWLR